MLDAVLMVDYSFIPVNPRTCSTVHYWYKHSKCYILASIWLKATFNARIILTALSFSIFPLQVSQGNVPGVESASLAMDTEEGVEVVWNEVLFSDKKVFKAQEVS